MTTDKLDGLFVAMVTSDLTECEDFPDGPCVILRGSKAAVETAAMHFGEEVRLVLVNPDLDPYEPA